MAGIDSRQHAKEERESRRGEGRTDVKYESEDWKERECGRDTG